MMPKISTSSFSTFVDHCLKISDRMTLEREQELFEKFNNGDNSVIEEIAVYHMRFVACVVYNMTKSSPVHYADALSHGFVGLLRAIKLYDYTFADNMRFAVFCFPHIKNEVCEYFIRMKNVYNCTGSKDQRKLYFQIPKLKKDINHLSLSEAEYIAEQTNTSVKDVFLTYQKIQPAQSLTIGFDDEENDEVLDFADDSYAPDVINELHESEDIIKQSLSHGLSLLDDRSRDIITSRWLSEKKAPLHVLGSKYNVSQERIRQIEANALATIRSNITVRDLYFSM